MRKDSKVVVGVDLGDRWSEVYAVSVETGQVVAEGRVATTREGVREALEKLSRARVVMEASTQSAWVSREVERMGHEAVVANPRAVRLIYADTRKDDRLDAEKLARLGRLDPKLLHPVRHRGEQAQWDYARLKGRDALVRARTLLINNVRAAVKATGDRLPACHAQVFARRAAAHVPADLREALTPLLEAIAAMTAQVKALEEQLERVAAERYPETARLQQVAGVGPLVSLGYVLTLEDAARFRRSRDVGPYLGLTPRRSQSGARDRQLGITKAGNPYLRRLLVQSAHHILGHRGPDTALRRWGLSLADRGGKNAKKRAVVAVARKLAVLLHRLWVTGRDYEPLRGCL